MKREKKEAKREAKRARHRARARDHDDDEGGTAGRMLRASPQSDPSANPGGLELRSREMADAREKREREEESLRRAMRSREETRRAEAAASEAISKRPENQDKPEMPVAPAAEEKLASPAFPGFGAAMTLEQYRAMASQKAYMRGTTHAVAARGTTQDDKESDPKASNKRNTQWACTSYKCGVDGAAKMNAKFADRCSACGAMKPLDAGAEVFKRTMTDAQYLANQSRRRGK